MMPVFGATNVIYLVARCTDVRSYRGQDRTSQRHKDEISVIESFGKEK